MKTYLTQTYNIWGRVIHDSQSGLPNQTNAIAKWLDMPLGWDEKNTANIKQPMYYHVVNVLMVKIRQLFCYKSHFNCRFALNAKYKKAPIKKNSKVRRRGNLPPSDPNTRGCNCSYRGKKRIQKSETRLSVETNERANTDKYLMKTELEMRQLIRSWNFGSVKKKHSIQSSKYLLLCRKPN